MTRPLATLRLFDEQAARAFLDALRSGQGLAAALASAGLSERLLFAWFKHAARRGEDPALEPYRRFRAEYLQVLGLAPGEAKATGS